jgi:hypothetical protein
MCQAHLVFPAANLRLQPSSMSTTEGDQQSLKDEIADLERRLRGAKSRLSSSDAIETLPTLANDAGSLSLRSQVLEKSLMLS